jgi:undecaprenyl-diphosphatase
MILKSIILGIIQGVTEFLPISSSGHLVIFQEYLGFESPGILFEVLLHFATLIAIVIVFAKRIGKIIKSVFTARIQMKEGHWVVPNENLRMFFFLIWASIPSALVGIFLKTHIERLFTRPWIVSIMLLVLGGILFSTKFVKKKKKKRLGGFSSTIIGIAQAFAIIPGISRSGATISAGLWTGLSREGSAEFSFILVIPAILGAMILEVRDLFKSVQEGLILVYVFGGIAAFVTGLVSLILLMKVVKKGKLYFFSYYCWVAGIATIIVNILYYKH